MQGMMLCRLLELTRTSYGADKFARTGIKVIKLAKIDIEATAFLRRQQHIGIELDTHSVELPWLSGRVTAVKALE